MSFNYDELCSSHDLERFDTHDYCLRHNCSVPTDQVCPVTLRIIARSNAQALRDAANRLPMAWPIAIHDWLNEVARNVEGIA